MDNATYSAFLRVFKSPLNLPPPVDAPDIKHRSGAEVRARYALAFSQLPTLGFDRKYKNPCWSDNMAGKDSGNTEGVVQCLPYVYLLGQPKCGSSDLFERLKRHPDVA